MQHPFDSPTPHHTQFGNSKLFKTLPAALRWPLSITTMLPVQGHLSLISSQYITRTLQPNNPSHSIVTSPSVIRNMKQSLQSRFLHCVSPYLWNRLYPPLIMGPPSSLIMLKLFPFPNLFYVITVSFRLLHQK